MNGIKDAMAGQRHNDDLRARLEPGYGRSREQRHHHRLDDHRLNRAAHRREQHVVRRSHIITVGRSRRRDGPKPIAIGQSVVDEVEGFAPNLRPPERR
jgi:hypothetical protein